MFRKQGLFNTNNDRIGQEFLYKDIALLEKKQKDPLDRINLDVELLEVFLLTINNKLEDKTEINSFNINYETLVIERSEIINLLKLHMPSIIAQNKQIVFEILEGSLNCKSCNNCIGCKTYPELFDNLINEYKEKFGIIFALDDYPNGQSKHLDNIKKAYVDTIKIDRIFGDIKFNKHMLEGTLDEFKDWLEENFLFLAKKTKITKVVIEGIETKEQWEWVQKLNPNGIQIVGQGYFLEMPK